MDLRTSKEVRSSLPTRLTGRALIALLFFAPLAYACTRPWPLLGLCIGLHVVFGLWLLSLWSDDRWPRLAPGVLVVSGLLWLYVWLRSFCFPLPPIDPFTQAHFMRIAERWPESIIWRTPARIAFLVSGLLLAFVVAADLSAKLRWRKRIVRAMILTSVLVVVLGLLENTTRAPGIFWERPVHSMPSRFFGSFYHFTSAGAFINLTWPLAAALAAYSWQQYKRTGTNRPAAWGWSSVTLLLLLAHTAHVSRFPQVLAVVGVGAMLIALRPWRLIRWSPRTAALLFATFAIFAVVALGVIHQSGQLSTIASRWRMMEIRPRTDTEQPPPPRSDWGRLMRDDLIVPYPHESYFLRDRGACYAFAWKCFLRRPLCGFGPGGWMAAVSEYADDPVIGTFYQYLQFTHQDYLQTLVEWGLIGAALAFLLVLIGIRDTLRKVWMLASCETFLDETQAVTFGALISIFAVLMQSLVDFPLQIPANAFYACVLLALGCSLFPSRSTPSVTSSVRHG